MNPQLAMLHPLGVGAALAIAAVIAWLLGKYSGVLDVTGTQTEVAPAPPATPVHTPQPHAINTDTRRQLFVMDAAGEISGPFPPRELADLRRVGKLSWKSLVAEAGADEWVEMQAYADVIEPGRRVSSVQAPVAADRGRGDTLAAAGKGLTALGAAVTLVNPIVGVGMMVAGAKVKKAGDNLQ